MLTVVIPYYQRTSGLLARSVESVLQQDCPWPVQVMVSDDESPLSAADALGADLLNDDRVRVLRQPNAGAGAARNLGLDHLPRATRFVGFLDSDDWWEPGFLDAAAHSLKHDDVDLFFSDSKRYGHTQSRFLWESDATQNLVAKEHLCVDGERALHEYRGDFFDFMLRRSSIIGTSSMVYRLSCAPALRFDTSLYNGQDRLFKLQLAGKVRRAVFSARALSMEGEGVNIFDSARWGSAKGLRLAASYVALGRTVRSSLALSDRQKRFVDAQIESARRDFVLSLLHALRQRLPVDRHVVHQTIRRDPALLPLIPLLASKAAFGKLTSKRVG